MMLCEPAKSSRASRVSTASLPFMALCAIVEANLERADLKPIAIAELLFFHAQAVDRDAVAAAHVGHPCLLAAQQHLSVPARHDRVVEHNIVVERAPDLNALFRQGEG